MFIALVAIAVCPAMGQSTSNGAPAGSFRLEICTVHLVKDIDVPARETGLLKAVLVEQNDAVAANQVIARIDDKTSQRMKEQAEHKHELAARQFEDEIQIKMAERKQLLTMEEYKVNAKLFKVRSKTLFETNRSLYQMQIAELEHTAAIKSQMLAGIKAKEEMVNVKAAIDSIARHVIESPIEGYILETYKEAGEWVNAGEKVVRVAPLSKIRVRGSIAHVEFNPREIMGKPVTVSLTRAHNEVVQFTGVVVLTSLENVGPTLYSVIAEVENRKDKDGKLYMLQAEASVVMDIHIDGKVPTRLANQPRN